MVIKFINGKEKQFDLQKYSFSLFNGILLIYYLNSDTAKYYTKYINKIIINDNIIYVN